MRHADRLTLLMRVLAIILNAKGIEPKNVYLVLKDLPGNPYASLKQAAVRRTIYQLKGEGLVAKRGTKYYIKDEQAAITRLSARNGTERPTKQPPRGRGWAAWVFTMDPMRWYTIEDIQKRVERYVDVDHRRVYQWVHRLNKDVDHKRFRGVHRYRAKERHIAFLEEEAKHVYSFVEGNPIPSPRNGERSTEGLTSTKTQQKLVTGHAKHEALPQIAGDSSVSPVLSNTLFYEQEVDPRIRISKKRRWYPLLPGVHQAVHQAFFQHGAVRMVDMGSWWRYVSKGVLRRRTRYGEQRVFYYLHLYPGRLLVEMCPWEGRDPWRMDAEMEFYLDDIMESLVLTFGDMFSGPGRSDYSEQELEHYDLGLARWIMSVGASADNKIMWFDNHRLKKWGDFSGERYSPDGETPEVGASTVDGKRLQVQDRLFRDELNQRTFEGVRDIQDRQRVDRRELEGLRRDLDALSSSVVEMGRSVRGFGEAIVGLVEKGREASPSSPPAFQEQDEREDDDHMYG